jgi:hypothetical protein
LNGESQVLRLNSCAGSSRILAHLPSTIWVVATVHSRLLERSIPNYIYNGYDVSDMIRSAKIATAENRTPTLLLLPSRRLGITVLPAAFSSAGTAMHSGGVSQATLDILDRTKGAFCIQLPDVLFGCG